MSQPAPCHSTDLLRCGHPVRLSNECGTLGSRAPIKPDQGQGPWGDSPNPRPGATSWPQQSWVSSVPGKPRAAQAVGYGGWTSTRGARRPSPSAVLLPREARGAPAHSPQGTQHGRAVAEGRLFPPHSWQCDTMETGPQFMVVCCSPITWKFS